MLELEPDGWLSTNYAVRLDGAPLTRVTAHEGPLAATFEYGGEAFVVQFVQDGGGIVERVVNLVLAAVTGSSAWSLSRVAGRAPLAIAHARGLRRHGFDVEIGATRSALDQHPDGFLWRGSDGEGRIERVGMRGLRAALPASLAPTVQVFVALLAQSTWETLSRGGE